MTKNNLPRCYECGIEIGLSTIEYALCWGAFLDPLCDDPDHHPDDPGWHVRCRDRVACAAHEAFLV